MLKIILFFVTTLSLNFSIAAPLDAKMSQEPNKSAHQVLKEFYESAQIAASVGDFDPPGPSNMKCAVAEIGGQVPYSLERLRVIEIAVNGTEGKGPLFPGQPPQIKKVVLTHWWFPGGNEVPLDYYQELALHASVEDRGSDLLISITTPPPSGRFSPSNFPLYLSLRKNNGLVTFQHIRQIEIIYGYCWRE